MPGIMEFSQKVLVLLSGGLDSTTLLSWIVDQVNRSIVQEVQAVGFRYGQRHEDAEIESASLIADFFDVKYNIVSIPGVFWKSPLIATSQEPVPVGMDPNRGAIAQTYVPRRNTVLLSIAAAQAEQIGFTSVAYAAHKTDSAYPDCTEQFARAFNRALFLGSDPAHPMSLYAPMIAWPKSQIVKVASELHAPVSLSHSCYQGMRPACGVCDTCQIRIAAFKANGLIDPISYAIPIDWTDCWMFPGQM